MPVRPCLRPAGLAVLVAVMIGGVAASSASAGVATYLATEGGGTDRSLVVQFTGDEADSVIARNGIPTRRSPATQVRVSDAGQVFVPEPTWNGETAECGGAIGELVCSAPSPLFFWPFVVLGGGADTGRLTGVGGGLLDGGSGPDVLRGSDGTVAPTTPPTNLGDELYGEGGADRLIGRAGADFLWGGADNDVILAADGYADAVYCWDGDADRATVDAADFVVGCERLTVE